MSTTSKPAVTPEMVERCDKLLSDLAHESSRLAAYNPKACNCWVYTRSQMAEFAASAVQDAVRECTEAFFLRYLSTEDSQGICAFCHHHCLSASQMSHFEGCKAAAMREKYGVKP